MARDSRQRPTYQLIELDFAILEVLPDEGTKLGFTQLGKQVHSIVSELNAALPHGTPGVKASQIGGRIRLLRDLEYVVSLLVQPVGRGMGWQRTRKGKRLLAEHEAEGGITVQDLQGSPT